MESKIFGYARVSSKDQNVDRQIDMLKPYVHNERDIFVDKASGKDFDRPAYNALKFNLRSDDTLYITSIDRLGRSKEGILTELRALKEMGVKVRILDLPTTMLDDGGTGLMETVSNIVIEVLAYIAERERVHIKKRQQEGIAAAKKRGKKFGRKRHELPDGWERDYARLKLGEITVAGLARKYGMTRQSLYRRLSEVEAKLKKEEEKRRLTCGEPMF